MSITDQSRARKTYSFYRSKPVLALVPASTIINVAAGLIVSSSNGVISIKLQQPSGSMSGSGGTFHLNSATFVIASGSLDLV